MIKPQSKKTGFTLIEMMVAVSIFIVVAFVVTSTFMVAMDAYRKAQQIRLTIDNVNYAMDTMVLEIREGNRYTYGDSSPCGGKTNCSFSFYNYLGKSVFYSVSAPDSAGNVSICRAEGGGACLALTDTKVNISYLNFNIFPTDTTGARPPMLQINVYGLVKVGKSQSDLNVQTTVTQRNPDPS
jgi:prepilin-type N-terminal cleavage/methylation domain-containing protein